MKLSYKIILSAKNCKDICPTKTDLLSFVKRKSDAQTFCHAFAMQLNIFAAQLHI